MGAFQRIITKIIGEDGLKGTYPYLDDVTIAGNTLEELDERAQQFENACKRRNMTLNEDKTVRNVNCLNILGYQIKHQHISPDPDRLKPLMDMPVPSTLKELKRVRGLFAYYSKWIMDFSTKIKLLAETRTFPLPEKSIEMFETLRKELAKITLMAMNEDRPFTLESDASHEAISATLNQDGKPVAFFSRSLNASQKSYPAVEKEAMAVVEAVKHWSHLLRKQKFTLVTDQRSMAFIYDNKRKSKIRNTKIIN